MGEESYPPGHTSPGKFMQSKMATFFTVFILTCGLVFSLVVGNPRTSEDKLGLLASGTTKFSMVMYKKLSESDTSMVFSPYNIHTALIMTYIGAKGKTEEEMSTTLCLDSLRGKTNVLAASRRLMTLLQDTGSVTLKVANGAYVGVPMKYGFQWGLKNWLNAEVKVLPEESGERETTINSWVAERTENKIPNLFSPGSLSKSKLVLVSAIYFKGMWAHPFDKQDTENATFNPPAGQSITVEMMIQGGQFRHTYIRDLDSEILELPYEGDRFAMYIILPRQKDGLASVEQELTAEELIETIDSLRSHSKRYIDVFLPKFTSKSRFELKETLEAMGMHRPFDLADFSSISDKPLRLDTVIHEAFIEVSEDGTEAAAATGVSFLGRSVTSSFYADHAFIYLIRDSHTNVTLFMGKYTGMD